jgi:hypothetical protein
MERKRRITTTDFPSPYFFSFIFLAGEWRRYLQITFFGIITPFCFSDTPHRSSPVSPQVAAFERPVYLCNIMLFSLVIHLINQFLMKQPPPLSLSDGCSFCHETLVSTPSTLYKSLSARHRGMEGVSRVDFCLVWIGNGRFMFLVSQRSFSH